jgi:hypothetical protein
MTKDRESIDADSEILPKEGGISNGGLVRQEGHLNVNIRFHLDLCDLFDGARRRGEVDDAFVHPELEMIVSLSTVTARSPPCCDS